MDTQEKQGKERCGVPEWWLFRDLACWVTQKEDKVTTASEGWERHGSHIKAGRES